MAKKAGTTPRRRRRRAPSFGLFQVASFASAIAEATGGDWLKNKVTDQIRASEREAILKHLNIPKGPLSGLAIGVIGETAHTAANRAHVNPGISVPGVITVRLI